MRFQAFLLRYSHLMYFIPYYPTYKHIWACTGYKPRVVLISDIGTLLRFFVPFKIHVCAYMGDPVHHLFRSICVYIRYKHMCFYAG